MKYENTKYSKPLTLSYLHNARRFSTAVAVWTIQWRCAVSVGIQELRQQKWRSWPSYLHPSGLKLW